DVLVARAPPTWPHATRTRYYLGKKVNLPLRNLTTSATEKRLLYFLAEVIALPSAKALRGPGFPVVADARSSFRLSTNCVKKRGCRNRASSRRRRSKFC